MAAGRRAGVASGGIRYATTLCAGNAMNSKITKALASFIGFARSTGRPASAPGKTGTTTGPASNAVLQNLARLRASPTGIASIRSGAARPRLSARDLPRAGIPASARATARAGARGSGKSTTGLAPDILDRFAALKGNPPTTNGKPNTDLAPDVLKRFEALKAKPPVTSEKSDTDVALDLQNRFNALKASMPKPSPRAHVVSTNEPVHGEKAADSEATMPKVETPKAETPKADLKAEGPKAEGPVDPAADARHELAGLEGKVQHHLDAMQNAVEAQPAQAALHTLLEQEVAELEQLALLISQIMLRLSQKSGEALLKLVGN